MFLSTLNPSSYKECRQAVTSAAVDLSLSTDEAVRQTCSDPYTVYSPGRLPDYHRPTGQYLLWIHSRGCKLMLKYLSYSAVTLQHGKMNYCCNSNTSHWRLPSHTCWTFGAVDSCLLLLKTFFTFVLTRACLTICSCERADDVWLLLDFTFSESKCCIFLYLNKIQCFHLNRPRLRHNSGRASAQADKLSTIIIIIELNCGSRFLELKGPLHPSNSDHL